MSPKEAFQLSRRLELLKSEAPLRKNNVHLYRSLPRTLVGILVAGWL